MQLLAQVDVERSRHLAREQEGRTAAAAAAPASDLLRGPPLVLVLVLVLVTVLMAVVVLALLALGARRRLHARLEVRLENVGNRGRSRRV